MRTKVYSISARRGEGYWNFYVLKAPDSKTWQVWTSDTEWYNSDAVMGKLDGLTLLATFPTKKQCVLYIRGGSHGLKN